MTLPPPNGLTLPRWLRRDRRALFLVTLSAILPVRLWIVVAMMSVIALLAKAMTHSLGLTIGSTGSKG